MPDDPFDGDPPIEPGPWRPTPGSVAEQRDTQRRATLAETTRRGLAKARAALQEQPPGGRTT